jgi:hypothetical protein
MTKKELSVKNIKIVLMVALLGCAGKSLMVGLAQSSSDSSSNDIQFNVTTSGTTGQHSISTGLTEEQVSNASGVAVNLTPGMLYDDFMDLVRVKHGMTNAAAFSVYVGDVDLSDKVQFKNWDMKSASGANLFVDNVYTGLLGDKYPLQFRVINCKDHSFSMMGFSRDSNYAGFVSVYDTFMKTIKYLCNFDDNHTFSVYTKSGKVDLSVEANFNAWNFGNDDGKTLYVMNSGENLLI